MSGTHHHFLQQVQAHFIEHEVSRHSSCTFATIRQSGYDPRPMLMASQSFENREPSGRVIIVIAAIEHTRSRQVRDLFAES